MLTWCELCLLLLIMGDKNSINYGNSRAGLAFSNNVQGATSVIIAQFATTLSLSLTMQIVSNTLHWVLSTLCNFIYLFSLNATFFLNINTECIVKVYNSYINTNKCSRCK